MERDTTSKQYIIAYVVLELLLENDYQVTIETVSIYIICLLNKRVYAYNIVDPKHVIAHTDLIVSPLIYPLLCLLPFNPFKHTCSKM